MKIKRPENEIPLKELFTERERDALCLWLNERLFDLEFYPNSTAQVRGKRFLPALRRLVRGLKDV